MWLDIVVSKLLASGCASFGFVSMSVTIQVKSIYNI